MESEAERRARADARRDAMTLHRTTLRRDEYDPSPVRGAEAISLVTRLTRESWSLSGAEMPEYQRADIPVRFVPRGRA